LFAAARAGGDPLTVAVVAWDCCGSRRQLHPALTSKRRLHLERYCTIADRLLGPGAGAHFLVDAILGHDAERAGEEVCSLDHFVCLLRRWVRQVRRQRKGLAPVPHEKAGWYLEREERREARAALKPRRRGARRGR
jgi:hypothetical protein